MSYASAPRASLLTWATAQKWFTEKGSPGSTPECAIFFAPRDRYIVSVSKHRECHITRGDNHVGRARKAPYWVTVPVLEDTYEQLLCCNRCVTITIPTGFGLAIGSPRAAGAFCLLD